MIEETKNNENPAVEKLESIGQLIVGEIEKIGGVLTADPIAQAEADIVQDAAAYRLETADTIEESEET